MHPQASWQESQVVVRSRVGLNRVRLTAKSRLHWVPQEPEKYYCFSVWWSRNVRPKETEQLKTEFFPHPGWIDPEPCVYKGRAKEVAPESNVYHFGSWNLHLSPFSLALVSSELCSQSGKHLQVVDYCVYYDLSIVPECCQYYYFLFLEHLVKLAVEMTLAYIPVLCKARQWKAQLVFWNSL